MQKNSSEHGFGAKSMADVINQVETKNHTEKVFNKIISSAAPPRARDPACAATKGLRTTNFVLSQFIETSHVGKSFESKQASIKDFSAAIPLRHVWRSMRMMKKMKCKSLSNALVKIQFHQLHLCPWTPPQNFMPSSSKQWKICRLPSNHPKLSSSLGITKSPSTLLSYKMGCCSWCMQAVKLTGTMALPRIFTLPLSLRVFRPARQVSFCPSHPAEQSLCHDFFNWTQGWEQQHSPQSPQQADVTSCIPPKFTKDHLNASF